MCIGGRQLGDFTAGTTEKPADLPAVVERCLTETTDGRWVVWAHKVAFRDGEQFLAITGDTYPRDARASCRLDRSHVAPVPACTCGFHAMSHSDAGVLRLYRPARKMDAAMSAAGIVGRLRRRLESAFSEPRASLLSVMLSGRILAFEYDGRSALFRAERQTVVRVNEPGERPGDPSGSREQLRPRQPMDVGPVRLEVPDDPVPQIEIADDAGLCVFGSRPVAARRQQPRTPAMSS